MTYTLALHRPEAPVTEEWRWETDIQVAYDGSESRVPLLRYPRRAFAGSMIFTRKQDITRQLALMFGRFGTAFKFPLEQYRVKLKAPIAVAATTAVVNALRSDLRSGQEALLREDDKWELVSILAVAEGEVTFSAPTVYAYSPRAWLCPVTLVHSATNAQMVRKNTDETAQGSFRYAENVPWAPFVSPLSAITVPTFDGLPVLDKRPVGTEFDEATDSGIRITDYLSSPDFYSPWLQARSAFSRTWLVETTFDPYGLHWWRAFCDLIRGSANPFLLPAFRADYDIVTAATAGGSFVRVAGSEYSQNYFGKDTYSRIVISSDAGRHYAKVVAVTTSSGNDRLQFSPPLPAGAGWTTNQRVELLLKVRVADDMVRLTHNEASAEVALSLRTVE